MDPANFLAQMKMGRVKGEGILRQAIIALTDVRTAAGLILTGATVPTIAATETNGLAIVAAASGTATGTILLDVPLDYDEEKDELYIDVLCNSAGDTNTPTLDATCYRKRAGAALSSDVAPAGAITTAMPTNTAKAAVKTLNLSGMSLVGGDSLTINLVASAHTTDAIQIWGAKVRYRGTLVTYDEDSR